MFWTWHNKISILKSVLRIIGYFLLLFNIYIAVLILMVCEAFGILEEF